MRSPAAELERCLLTHLDRQPIDFDRALAQHAAFRACLDELGLDVSCLAALPGSADAVFVEDLALVLPQVNVICRPAAASRAGEVEPMRQDLATWRPAAATRELTADATLEGGDVLAIGDVLWVGQSTRTNHAGLKQLAHLVLEFGQRVQAVQVRGCLHLRTAVTNLGQEELLINPQWIESERLRDFAWIEVHPDEPFGANAIRVGNTIVMSASHPRTAERLARRGYQVRVVEIGEFEKAEAGVSCLCLRES